MCKFVHVFGSTHPPTLDQNLTVFAIPGIDLDTLTATKSCNKCTIQ